MAAQLAFSTSSAGISGRNASTKAQSVFTELLIAQERGASVPELRKMARSLGLI